MNKKYVIDGRDPNAKGYVAEGRMATKAEDEACRKALMCFRVGDAWSKDIDFFLYGRLDDIHGWYVFGVKGGDKPQFLILGDCLDVLEKPYNRVLGMNEVIQFARNEGSGENIGTAYDALQEWGVFSSLSDEFCQVLDALDVAVENERAYWDESRGEWKLYYDVHYITDSGADESAHIVIPAQLDTQRDADVEFASEWKAYADSLDADTIATNVCDMGGAVKDALEWAESKVGRVEEIKRNINAYIDDGVLPDEEKDGEVTVLKSDGERVWVLTIVKDGDVFPEVHRTLYGAVQGVIANIAATMKEDEVDMYPHDDIEKAMEEQHYWKDEYKGEVYDIAECPVGR